MDIMLKRQLLHFFNHSCSILISESSLITQETVYYVPTIIKQTDFLQRCPFLLEITNLPQTASFHFQGTFN